jgi:hypothetical protein
VPDLYGLLHCASCRIDVLCTWSTQEDEMPCEDCDGPLEPVGVQVLAMEAPCLEGLMWALRKAQIRRLQA